MSINGFRTYIKLRRFSTKQINMQESTVIYNMSKRTQQKLTP